MNTHKKGQIESGKIVIMDIFTNFWFCIPTYQRSYVWGKDEVSELIDDVKYASENSPDSQYFLGSMVLQKRAEAVLYQNNNFDFDVHDVLDGQQRLTSIFLMIAVIRDLAEEKDLRDNCQNMLFQKENRWTRTPCRNRLVYQIRDDVGIFINDFIIPIDGTKNNDILVKKVDENNLSIANMAKAVIFMRNHFSKWSIDDLNKFTNYLFHNALFIYVSSEDLDDAFRLFTILNDRGIPLSNSDILKARNLGMVSNTTDNAKWAEFWETTEGEFGRDEFDRFLSFVRTIYVKDKARESLLKEFDERIYGAKPPLLNLGEDTFKAIKLYKSAYDEAVLFNPLPTGLGNEYRNLITVMKKSLPSTDWIPAILFWYDKFKTADFLVFIKKLDNKFSADWILQMTPTQRIWNMNDILKKIENSAKTGDVLSDPAIFSYDKPGLINLLEGDIYGRRFAKYVLLRLENLYFNHTSVLPFPDELSVEHILPQNPSAGSQWNKDFNPTDKSKWLNKLGNLLLLSRRKNTSLSNLDFTDKRCRYFTSNVETLPNSCRVMGLSKFKVSDVENRHKDLLAKLSASY